MRRVDRVLSFGLLMDIVKELLEYHSLLWMAASNVSRVTDSVHSEVWGTFLTLNDAPASIGSTMVECFLSEDM